MNPGDAVQVFYIWASGSACQPGLAAWHDGYRFVRTETDETRPAILHGRPATCIVSPTEGAFAGCEVRYDVTDVRAAP